ncbi:hypothetical protein [Paenibacillus silvisoli]|uniref:hypothetical protein n=1 Tax=Paenibacillus silvisoli TaxID=3110539 RepID=UPI002803E111|nr:hypothetical protein [Paenibacillus silvisoli]
MKQLSMSRLDQLRRFIANGDYLRMLEAERKYKLLYEQIREYQDAIGMRRIYWQTEGVVGFFDSVRVFEEDSIKLKEYLMQLGLLPVVVKVSWTALLLEEQNQVKQMVVHLPASLKLVISKKITTNPQQLKEFTNVIDKQCVKNKVLLWKREKMIYENLKKEWNKIKSALLVEMHPNEIIQFDYGSVSCFSKDPIIRNTDIYQELGEEVLMSRGKIDSKQLTFYMTRGFISKREVTQYRKIRDIRIRYTLITLENLIRRNEHYQQSLLKSYLL